jgi:hypothetical protein
VPSAVPWRGEESGSKAEARDLVVRRRATAMSRVGVAEELTVVRDLDAARLLDNVTTFHFHPHLPHYELTTPESDSVRCWAASASTPIGPTPSPQQVTASSTR